MQRKGRRNYAGEYHSTFPWIFLCDGSHEKIDAICGEDWGGDEEIFRNNSDLKDLSATYKEGMREYRRGIGPDMVLGGNNEVLTDILKDMRGFREVEGGAKEYILFSKDVLEILGHEGGILRDGRGR